VHDIVPRFAARQPFDIGDFRGLQLRRADVAPAQFRFSGGDVVEVHSTEQRTANEILRDADLARYEAKRANRRSGG